MLFVISTFENGKLSHICGISTFTYCPSIKSEISDFTVQIYFVNFPVYWVCLAIVWLGKLILEKIFIFIRTHYICCAFHTLLNKFTVGKWLRFFFFSNHITESVWVLTFWKRFWDDRFVFSFAILFLRSILWHASHLAIFLQIMSFPIVIFENWHCFLTN